MCITGLMVNGTLASITDTGQGAGQGDCLVAFGADDDEDEDDDEVNSSVGCSDDEEEEEEALDCDVVSCVVVVAAAGSAILPRLASCGALGMIVIELRATLARVSAEVVLVLGTAAAAEEDTVDVVVVGVLSLLSSVLSVKTGFRFPLGFQISTLLPPFPLLLLLLPAPPLLMNAVPFPTG